MYMSNLIRSRKAMTTTPRSPPPAHSSVATTPASSMALPVSARCGHHRPLTLDTPLASTTDASGSQQGKV
ncbi:hypothetical protein DVH24_015762 [Malus domestica]|uniref:Uncharacterized protein n=1 Tax=Malus domestica TaxID=3750 RepID=A0A498HK97_MALDO|nr:hypothetical protein DVH24_015762 [Malus domestica]